jgi:myo-inositol-1(or 4)-monophosphatase
MKALLTEALKLAADSLRQNFSRSLTVSVKESQSSIVTNADLESEKIIIRTIQKTYPGHNIISEEFGFIDNGSEFTWVIDPLDGTSNFASKIPWFGVLIALLKNGNPCLAGACLPVQQDLYFSEKGAGSYRNGERIRVTSAPDLREALVAFDTDYTTDESYLDRGLAIARRLISGSRNLRSTNSLVDFLYVAEGKLGACVNLFTKIWDIAAPRLIIEEAGGFMTDIHGEEFRFITNAADYAKNYPVLAGSCALKEKLISIIS